MKIHGRIKCSLIFLTTCLSLSTQAMEPEAVPGEFIVKMKPSVSVARETMQALDRNIGSFVSAAIPEANIVVVRRPVFEMSTYAMEDLSNNPDVEYVEPNYIYRALKTPNDPSFGSLWGMQAIDAARAWDIQTGSKDVIVAVIDTGVDYTHPDLVNNIWVNKAEKNGRKGVDDDGNGYVDDVYGIDFSDPRNPKANGKDDNSHGTHCSGTIGGQGNNGRGVAGVAWNVRIMPVKFLSASGSGTLEGAVRAIDYAVRNGAKILSNSWGGGAYSRALQEAIERSNDAKTLFVAAAGNENNNNDKSPSYPSGYKVSNILAVAATASGGGIAAFSNYGKKSVHVGAPGVQIYSSIPGGKYAAYSGTSMATPHVAGIAALVLSQNPGMSGSQLKSRIMSTVVPLASLKSKTSTGGLVSAYGAVANKKSRISSTYLDENL